MIIEEPDLSVLDAATVFDIDDPRWAKIGKLVDCISCYTETPARKIVDHALAHNMVLTNKVPLTAKHIAALPDLKYIGVLATGYNIIDLAAATEAGIVVTNIPAYSTASVAQHAISLLLAITNRVESYSTEVHGGRWTASSAFTFLIEDWHELDGKTFGVVGFGNTGRATAAIAKALGMKIAVYTSKSQQELPEGYVKVGLDELFANSDVVSLHCPLTPDTQGLVNSRRLRLMKRSAILINTSRGPVVNATDLAKALVEGRIYAAGIDVLDNEPPRPGNPLLAAPRCYITPHIAWESVEARERLLDIAAENVKAFIDGNPINVVNKEVLGHIGFE